MCACVSYTSLIFKGSFKVYKVQNEVLIPDYSAADLVAIHNVELMK